jgi:nitrate reductase cytochrome c-type subunit
MKEAKKMKKILLLAVALLLVGGTALAFGPHDNNCVECHSLHYAKGAAIIGVDPVVTDNPATEAKTFGDVSLCLGCHNDDEGIMPILLTTTHPVGMKPNKVVVPAGLLREDGTLGCTSCHDPHPSNPNYQYLRIDGGSIAKSGELGKFCAICHPKKADTSKFVEKKVVPAKKKK